MELARRRWPPTCCLIELAILGIFDETLAFHEGGQGIFVKTPQSIEGGHFIITNTHILSKMAKWDV